MTHVNVEKESRSTVVDFPSGVVAAKGDQVQRLNGYFLYEVGAALRPITITHPGATKLQFRTHLFAAEQWLTSMLGQTLIPLRTSVHKGWELVRILRDAKTQYEALTQEQLNETLDFWGGWHISSAASEFQTLLSAELSLADLYIVAKKGAYDVTELAERGLSAFPPLLAIKVPDAVLDAQQAARCIAFELPTAAAFHLHLVLERVMRAYYDHVTGGKPHPDTRGVRAYIDAMKGQGVGDQKVFSALADVARFHRNPVLHPDDKLDSVDDAMALLGTIYSTLLAMLKVLPDPKPQAVEDAKVKAIAAA
jgi:hypothetical protein